MSAAFILSIYKIYLDFFPCCTQREKNCAECLLIKVILNPKERERLTVLQLFIHWNLCTEMIIFCS